MINDSFKDSLRFFIFVIGIVYFSLNIIRTYKRTNFLRSWNRCIFILGAISGVSSLFLLALAYYLYYIINFPTNKKYIFYLFSYMALVVPFSGYCYYKSLIDEARYKLEICKKILPNEYSIWRKKKEFFFYLEVIMAITTLIGIITL